MINVDLNPGQIIEAHVGCAKPGQGLQPNRKADLVGKTVKRNLYSGDMLFPSDLGEDIATARNFRFHRPFGIPVRYHDLNSLAGESNFDLLEFHFSYKDLEEDEEQYFKHIWDMNFLVHAPELFEGDHILDLCSKILNTGHCPDSTYKGSDVTRRLRKWFKRASRTGIVTNVGGFTQDKPLEKQEIIKR